MITQKFVRKPFFVDAIQVTEENMAEVAEWCHGDIRTAKATVNHPAKKYIKVRVHRPINDRQTHAYVGDWVLYAGTGFKVYTNTAFYGNFEPAVEVGELITD